MKLLLIGMAVTAGPALTWHLLVVARRYDATPPDLPSGPTAAGARTVLATPGPDGCSTTSPANPVRATREDHR